MVFAIFNIRKIPKIIILSLILALIVPVCNATDVEQFSFYGVYDRLADTDSHKVNINHAALSGDGNKLVFSGVDIDNANLILYTVNADGSDLTIIPVPSEIQGIDDLVINKDGSRIFFSGRWSIYNVEDRTLTQILDTNDYPEINAVKKIQTTADGEYVYFMEDRDDLWRLRHGGGSPELVIEDTEVSRVDSNGEEAWAVCNFVISNDASTIAFILMGYHDPTNYYGITSKQELFVSQMGSCQQLTDDVGDVSKLHMDISGDGTVIVFSSAESPENKWYSIHSDGSSNIALEKLGFNVAGVSLNYDGTKMFYSDGLAEGGRLVNTDGSGGIDLFPRYNVNTITISATWDPCISDDGRRVSFRFGYSSWPFKEALYIGHLNNPDAVVDAPFIHNIVFNPPFMPRNDPESSIILKSKISDPQGLSDIDRTSIDHMIEGRFSSIQNSPAYLRYAPNDGGNPPDETAGDGIFSAECEPGEMINELDQMTVRVGAMDASNTVVVADTVLSIGSASTTQITPSITPSSKHVGFSGLMFESRSKTVGSNNVQIPLTLVGVREDIGNMDLTLSYDPSVIEAKTVIKGGVTDESIFDHNILDGTIKISLADNLGFSGDGSVAFVVFDVIGNEGSTSPLKIVSLSVNRADDMSTMDISTKNGLFTVLGSGQGIGDCNGDGQITALDALCALQMSVGKKPENPEMDINKDGKVSSLDARKILRIAANLETL